MREIVGRRLGLWPALTAVCTVIATIALCDLAIKSAVDFNPGWDGLTYHLPFAALRAGLSVPFDMNEQFWPRYQGFPPLPELVQGLLWRLSGSVNATGVLNIVAFGLFLAFCHKVLAASYWLVALISLTAPLVLIHMTVGYVDAFANAFLAMGVSACLSLYLLPERGTHFAVAGGLAGLAAAAWSKSLLVPVVAVMFLLMAVVALRPAAKSLSRRSVVAMIFVFGMLAVSPYAKNLAVYGNPFWPERVPMAGTLFPYLEDATTSGATDNRPESLVAAPQAEVFVKSLFEIDVPTSNSPRWLLDQGLPGDGFRMGGFWGFGVVAYLLITVSLLVACFGRRGAVAAAIGASLLGLVAVLPQSNELRYYMFIPLAWAAAIAVTYPILRERHARAAEGLLVLILALFAYVASASQAYYQIQGAGYQDVAVASGAVAWWPRLQHGQTYCVVQMPYRSLMMTGPTMSEFSIVDRSDRSLCPAGATVVTADGVQTP